MREKTWQVLFQCKWPLSRAFRYTSRDDLIQEVNHIG